MYIRIYIYIYIYIYVYIYIYIMYIRIYTHIYIYVYTYERLSLLNETLRYACQIAWALASTRYHTFYAMLEQDQTCASDLASLFLHPGYFFSQDTWTGNTTAVIRYFRNDLELYVRNSICNTSRIQWRILRGCMGFN